MKHLKVISESSKFLFQTTANELLEEGYEPIGSIAVNYTEEGWLFTQPFGIPGMNDTYYQKINN